MDVFLPSVAIAQAFGRIGCFLGGCCYGRPVATLGVVFSEGSPAFSRYGHCPVVPVQLMESAWLFCVGIVLFCLIKFRDRFVWYLVLVGIGRFVLEFFRGDVRNDIWLTCPLSPAQCISLMLVACAALLFFHARATSIMGEGRIVSSAGVGRVPSVGSSEELEVQDVAC